MLDQLLDRGRTECEEHDTASQKGYDAGSGIKRHIAVDTQGLPHAIAVTTADVTDRKGALAAFDRCADNLEHVVSVLVDGSYSASRSPTRSRTSSMQPSRSPNAVICIRSPSCPSDGSVERSFAWLENAEDSLKNCERKLNTSLPMIHLAFLAQLLRKA